MRLAPTIHSASEPVPSASRDAWRAALIDLAPRVHQWTRRQLGPDPDAEDIAQEALMAIADALPRFRGEASLSTFAYRITRRVAWKHVKRRRRRQEVVLHSVREPATDRAGEDWAMDREAVRRLYRALDRLSEKRRSAFVMCAIESVPHDRAAGMEGVSIETLRARLKRARAELGRLLSHDAYFGPMLGSEEGRP